MYTQRIGIEKIEKQIETTELTAESETADSLDELLLPYMSMDSNSLAQDITDELAELFRNNGIECVNQSFIKILAFTRKTLRVHHDLVERLIYYCFDVDNKTTDIDKIPKDVLIQALLEFRLLQGYIDKGFKNEILYGAYEYDSIDELDLCVRHYQAFKRSGITTISQLLGKSDDELMAIRFLDKRDISKINKKLSFHRTLALIDAI